MATRLENETTFLPFGLFFVFLQNVNRRFLFNFLKCLFFKFFYCFSFPLSPLYLSVQPCSLYLFRLLLSAFYFPISLLSSIFSLLSSFFSPLSSFFFLLSSFLSILSSFFSPLSSLYLPCFPLSLLSSSFFFLLFLSAFSIQISLIFPNQRSAFEFQMQMPSSILPTLWIKFNFDSLSLEVENDHFKIFKI
jgi:hypothetical protein